MYPGGQVNDGKSLSTFAPRLLLYLARAAPILCLLIPSCCSNSSFELGYCGIRSGVPLSLWQMYDVDVLVGRRTDLPCNR